MAHAPRAQVKPGTPGARGEVDGAQGEEGRMPPPDPRLQPATLRILTPFTLPPSSNNDQPRDEGKGEAPTSEPTAPTVSSKRDRPSTGPPGVGVPGTREPSEAIASSVISGREEPRAGETAGHKGDKQGDKGQGVPKRDRGETRQGGGR